MRFPDYGTAKEAADTLSHYAELSATKNEEVRTYFQTNFWNLAIEYSLENIAEALGYTVTKKEDDNG